MDKAGGNSLENRIADVLTDFAAVLTEEMAAALGLSWEVEARIMERISPILNRFRDGKSLAPSEAYKREE